MKLLVVVFGFLPLSATASTLFERVNVGDNPNELCKNKTSQVCYEGSMKLSDCIFDQDILGLKGATPTPPKDQQKCLCGSDVWTFSQICMDCQWLAASEAEESGIPQVDYERLSSAYCDKGPATVGYLAWQSESASSFTTSLPYLTAISNTQHTQNDTKPDAKVTSTKPTATWPAVHPTTTGSTTGNETAAETATPTGVASSLRQDGRLLVKVAGVIMALGLLG